MDISFSWYTSFGVFCVSTCIYLYPTSTCSRTVCSGNDDNIKNVNNSKRNNDKSLLIRVTYEVGFNGSYVVAWMSISYKHSGMFWWTTGYLNFGQACGWSVCDTCQARKGGAPENFTCKNFW